MSLAVITGSAGLIGSETHHRFHAAGFNAAGIDTDMNARYFGVEVEAIVACHGNGTAH